MFDSILSTLESIGSFFTWIWDITVSYFNEMMNFFSMVTVVFSNVGSYISWLPIYVTGTVSTIIVIAILYKILGREG